MRNPHPNKPEPSRVFRNRSEQNIIQRARQHARLMAEKAKKKFARLYKK